MHAPDQAPTPTIAGDFRGEARARAAASRARAIGAPIAVGFLAMRAPNLTGPLLEVAEEIVRRGLSVQPPLKPEDVATFARAYRFDPPAPFTDFLTRVGNGVQRADGEWIVFPLGVTFNAARGMLVRWSDGEIGDLAEPFSLGSASAVPPPGAIPIAHDDGVLSYLVVSGPDRGTVWPSRLDFARWLLGRLRG